MRITLVFILLMFCRICSGSQEEAVCETGYDYFNYTISYESYEQDFSSNLFNLLTYLSLYYDEYKLLIRIAEIASTFLLNFYVHKLGNPVSNNLKIIVNASTLLDFIYNIVYDEYFTNDDDDESWRLYRFKPLAKRIEHLTTLVLSDYLSIKLFASTICPICMETITYPIVYAPCNRHWYCFVCLIRWSIKPFSWSFSCPLCRSPG